MVTTEAVAIMTAIDSAPPRLRLPADFQRVDRVAMRGFSRLRLSASPFPLCALSGRTISALLLIRLFNYRVEMLFTETCAELTVEQR